MSAITEIGTALGRAASILQVRKIPKEPTTPYEHAEKLWQALAPNQEVHPQRTALFALEFQPDNRSGGVRPEEGEQELFVNLMRPYRNLLSDKEVFHVALSLAAKSSSVSFAATVYAPSLSFDPERYNPSPVLAIRELPATDFTDYNLLILAEGSLYSGKLDRQLAEFDASKKTLTSVDFSEWQNTPIGDLEWRKRFAKDVFSFWTNIIETNREGAVRQNQRLQASFKEQERSIPLWRRLLLADGVPQRGAVSPYLFGVSVLRDSTFGSDPTRLVDIFQQA
jgi:hypothetical protein